MGREIPTEVGQARRSRYLLPRNAWLHLSRSCLELPLRFSALLQLLDTISFQKQGLRRQTNWPLSSLLSCCWWEMGATHSQAPHTSRSGCRSKDRIVSPATAGKSLTVPRMPPVVLCLIMATVERRRERSSLHDLERYPNHQVRYQEKNTTTPSTERLTTMIMRRRYLLEVILALCQSILMSRETMAFQESMSERLQRMEFVREMERLEKETLQKKSQKSLQERLLKVAKEIIPNSFLKNDERGLANNNNNYNYQGDDNLQNYVYTDNDVGIDLSGYALKYVGCQNVHNWDDNLATSNGEPLAMNRFVMFRLCKANDCSAYNKWGCNFNFGEYVIPMEDYLSIMAEYHFEQFGRFCKTCYHCMNLDYYKDDDDATTANNATGDDTYYTEDDGVACNLNDDSCSDDVYWADYRKYWGERRKRKLDEDNYNYNNNNNQGNVSEEGRNDLVSHGAKNYYYGDDGIEDDNVNYNRGVSANHAVQTLSPPGLYSYTIFRLLHQDDYYNNDVNKYPWYADQYGKCLFEDVCSDYRKTCRTFDPEATHYETYFTCSSLNIGGAHAYLGPHCRSDGRTIGIGIYNDQYCNEYIGDTADITEATGMSFDDGDLKNYYDKDCISCSAEESYSLITDDTLGSGSDLTYPLCSLAYQVSGKCNRYMSSSVNANNDDNQSLVERNYNERGEVVLMSSYFNPDNWNNPREYVKVVSEATAFQKLFLTLSMMIFFGLLVYAVYLTKKLVYRKPWRPPPSVTSPYVGGRDARFASAVSEAGRVSRASSGIVQLRSMSGEGASVYNESASVANSQLGLHSLAASLGKSGAHAKEKNIGSRSFVTWHQRGSLRGTSSPCPSSDRSSNVSASEGQCMVPDKASEMPSFLLVLFCVLFQACPCRRIIGQPQLKTRGRRNDPPILLRLPMSSQPQQQEVDSKETPCRRFFAAFNDHVNERVNKADQVQHVSSDMSDTLLISMSTIAEELYSAHAMEFVEKFAANGGTALLKLSEKDAEVLSNMWDLANTVFDEIDRLEGEQTVKDLGVRYQNLVRGIDKISATKEVGYSYVEINNRDKSLSALDSVVGSSSASKVASDSLNTLTEIGTRLAAVVAAAMIPMEPTKAHELMKSLVGKPCEEKSISFQRLARYMEANPDEEQTKNLGSHCDWSIFTIIPVSDVSGLQVYDVSSQTWICPEAVARKHGGNDLSETWNGSYAVVMAGKYLEVLTNGQVESTIHRVVSRRNTPQRYSAPFFLRLNLDVLNTLESVALEQPDDVLASRLAMSKFLQGLSCGRKGRW
eukprot:scaffold149_cov179-Amphora_coffeaeformis.AAC.17